MDSTNWVTMIVHLSSEYPAILDGILYMFTAIGVYIAATGIYFIIKMGRKDHGLITPGAHVAWRLIGGMSLANLSMFAKAWSGTLWANPDPLGIGAYSGGGGNFDSAIMAAIGIMVITGYVVIGRAYMMASRLGTVSIEARSDLVGSIFARIFAGSALICTIHIANAIGNSTGANFFSP